MESPIDMKSAEKGMLYTGPMMLVITATMLWLRTYGPNIFEGYRSLVIFLGVILALAVTIRIYLRLVLALTKYSEKVMLILGALGWVLWLVFMVVWVVIQMKGA